MTHAVAGPDCPGAGARPALPVVSVIGRKNSGKTTLVVALAAELRRRGVRVAVTLADIVQQRIAGC